jgi:hypothetical protein
MSDRQVVTGHPAKGRAVVWDEQLDEMLIPGLPDLALSLECRADHPS